MRAVTKDRSPRLAARIAAEIQAALASQTLTLPFEETRGEVIADLIGDLDRIQRREPSRTADRTGIKLRAVPLAIDAP